MKETYTYQELIEEQIKLLESMKYNDTGVMSSMSEYTHNGRFDQDIDKKINELKTQIK